MGRDVFVLEFLDRGLLGFYLAVVREGDAAAGDPIVELHRDPRGFRATEIARLYVRDPDDVEAMRRAIELDRLPESWRAYFRKRLDSLAHDAAKEQIRARAPQLRQNLVEECGELTHSEIGRSELRPHAIADWPSEEDVRRWKEPVTMVMQRS